MRKLFLLSAASVALVTGCFSSGSEKVVEISGKNERAHAFTAEFKSAEGWSLNAGAKFDPKVSATPGSGSIRFSKTGDSGRTSDGILSNIKLSVKAGHTYTLSFKSKTETFPPPVVEVYGEMLGEDGLIANSFGTMCANSQKGKWEENYVIIRISKNDMIKYFKPKILMAPKKSRSAPVWIDDVRFEEGIKLPQRSTKKSFDGSVTRVDALGNIEIKKGGKFVPFFPIGIYADANRADWRVYKKMGFNTNMWASNIASIKKSKDAGLYAGMQIVQYVVPVGEDWIPQDPQKKRAHLHKTLQKIRQSGLSNNLLFYYVDNEFYHLKPAFTDVVDIVRQEDRNAHPVYMLSGAYGMARMYNDYVDMTGTYVAKDGYETPTVEAFEALDKTPNQKQPVVFAQINRGVGRNFRPVLYGAIAKGAKGVGFWRDGGSAGGIESRPVAKQLPKIAQEIEQLMPLIRTSHETKWQAVCDSEKLIYGTRTLEKRGYMIVANPNRKKVTTECSLDGLPYGVKKAEDFFSHKSIADVSNNKMRISIEPHDAVVLKLVP